MSKPKSMDCLAPKSPKERVERLKALRDRIAVSPTEPTEDAMAFQMDDWGYKSPCGTAGCVAGHCVTLPLFAKKAPNQVRWVAGPDGYASLDTTGAGVADDAAAFLGLTMGEASPLFYDWKGGPREDVKAAKLAELDKLIAGTGSDWKAPSYADFDI